ncbi:hypothetical protein CRUP_008841 [Coryphaenoides rupestris]|nr:hypothetical protein CRUP_008841 [Coryphaenoides rupestris]
MAPPARLITGVDLRSRENNRAHRTEEIDRDRLIVRRGQPFSLTVQCSDSLASGYELAVVLEQDKISGDIVIRQRTTGGSNHDEWWFRQQRAQNELLLTVYSPARAAVGQHHLAVFEDNVMDICFEILERARPALDRSQRWDPVYISRVVIAMVNANDDNGVLKGKWQAPYSDGVVPSSGARPILRCLGIPTRCITNFSSAHDTDGNLSIDRFYDMNNKEVNTGDSIWNFHCWIESYMQREDLPEGYGGWQVLDSTPQEQSSGMFRCGPCPLKAIKEGELRMKYDAPFIFAEVNADIIEWEIRPGGQRMQLASNSTGVGMNISTKSPYSDEREDITLQYKYPEGSAKEREVYNKAGRRSRPGKEEEEREEAEKPGHVELEVKFAKPVFGTDFDVIFEASCNLKNTGDKEVSCKLNMMSKAVAYNSVHLGEFQNSTVNVVVSARKAHREVVRLLYERYAPCVNEHNIIRVVGVAQVSGQDKSIVKAVNIPLSKPELSIQIPGWVIYNQRISAFISFTNPLPVPLKSGVFTVEGAGLLSTKEIRISDSIMPGQHVKVELMFTPMRVGVRKLLVDFDSDRLQDVKGSATVVVRKTPPKYF